MIKISALSISFCTFYKNILQIKYGEGIITDVSWDDDEVPTKFTVEFDNGIERKFVYPFAFTTGMKIKNQT